MKINIDKLKDKLTPEQKMQLMPNFDDVNTAQKQQVIDYMKYMKQFMLRNKDDKYDILDNNFKTIKRGIIPANYFTRFNVYLDSFINYFCEKIDIEQTELTYKQWETAKTLLWTTFYFGRCIAEYNDKTKEYQVYLPVEVNVSLTGVWDGGSGIPVGSLSNLMGVIAGKNLNTKGYKTVNLSKNSSVYFRLNRYNMGFVYSLRDWILMTIYFENKCENVGIIESIKAYEKTSDITSESRLENQITSDNCIVIKRDINSLSDNDSKLEILDIKSDDKIRGLSNYIDWRDARLAKYLGVKENSVKFKNANLLSDEVNGVNEQQENRFEYYYDIFRTGFMALKEIYPSSPIELERYKDLVLKQQMDEVNKAQEDDNKDQLKKDIKIAGEGEKV